jgi:hypothetical protein
VSDPVCWISAEEAAAIAPGLHAGKLRALRREKAGPPVRLLSDGEAIYDELLFRRWLESTVDPLWVHGPFGARRITTPERAHRYDDAPLTLLRGRTYISPDQLLELIPDLPQWVAIELRRSGVGPRVLRPTPRTAIYVAEEALWWAENVPSMSARHERGVDRRGILRRPLDPPIGITQALPRRMNVAPPGQMDPRD